MQPGQIEYVANTLIQARLHAAPIIQISETEKEFSRAEAYAIQEMGIKDRIDKGEKWLGFKMGLTSEAKRKQMNLESPLYGELTDKMQVTNGVFDLKGGIHPKIEPEIAFLTRKELRGKVTYDEVLEACSHACTALEILDSRYTQFKYFSMEDVIADNSSSSHYVLGDWVWDFKNMDLKNLKMFMYVDEQMIESGYSSAISGDPINSIIELCDLLEFRNRSVPAGSIVLTGAATAAVALKPGMKVKLLVDNFQNLEVSVK